MIAISDLLGKRAESYLSLANKMHKVAAEAFGPEE